MGLCLVSDAKTNWQELMKSGATQLKGKGFRTTLCKLAWWSVVYHICQRNAIIHVGRIYTEEQIIGIIKKDVKGRMESKKCSCNSVLNRVLCYNWGINPALLCFQP